MSARVVFALTTLAGAPFQPPYPTFEEEWHDCASAKALGVFKGVDWSIEQCAQDAMVYLHALHGPYDEETRESRQSRVLNE